MRAQKWITLAERRGSKLVKDRTIFNVWNIKQYIQNLTLCCSRTTMKLRYILRDLFLDAHKIRIKMCFWHLKHIKCFRLRQHQNIIHIWTMSTKMNLQKYIKDIIYSINNKLHLLCMWNPVFEVYSKLSLEYYRQRLCPFKGKKRKHFCICINDLSLTMPAKTRRKKGYSK